MYEIIEEEERIVRERESRREANLRLSIFERPISRICGRSAETVDISATVGDACRVMQAEKLGSVLVEADGRLVGIVTERDILMKVMLNEEDLCARPISTIMTPNPEVLRKDDSIIFLLNKMHVGGFRHVPIVDEQGVPLHVISIRDVAAFILDFFPDEVLVNIPSEPFRGMPVRDSG